MRHPLMVIFKHLLNVPDNVEIPVGSNMVLDCSPKGWVTGIKFSENWWVKTMRPFSFNPFRQFATNL